MQSRAKSRLLIGYLAVLYAFGLLAFCGAISTDQWYSPSYGPRLQAEAFLHGRLAVSHNPSDLDHDLCWSEGGVQQVWGLGVPLWELPFEAGAKLLGMAPFPERIALAIFIGLSAYVVFRTWAGPLLNENGDSVSVSQIVPWQQRVNRAGVIALFFFFPPVTALLRYRSLVYEEIMVYLYFFGILLLCGLVALVRNPKWGRFWLLCFLAGLGVLIRPTLLFYGVATFVTAGLAMVSSQRGSECFFSPRWALNPRLIFGALLFAFGGTLVFVTNYLRFGSGWEFGHRLNLQSGGLLASVYSTRFGYPFSRAPVLGAARELMGALFQIRDLNGFDWYTSSGVMAGQSPVFRWREFSFSTYRMEAGVGVALAWLIGAWTGWKWLKSGRRRDGVEPSRLSTEILMIAWSGIAAVPLIGFYVKTPIIASRYMMDFAPAFVAALAGLWCWVNRHWRTQSWYSSRIGAGVLAALLLWEGAGIGQAQYLDSPSHAFTRQEAINLKKVTEGNPPPLNLPNEYKMGDSSDLENVPFNGEGWDPLDGSMSLCAIVFVQTPEFLEMEVAAAPGSQLTEAALANIRVKVGLEYLKRESVTSTNGGWILHFSGPKQRMYQQGLQPVFLAMVPPNELAQYALARSPWILKRVQWRKK
jgi:hypothetical protein